MPETPHAVRGNGHTVEFDTNGSIVAIRLDGREVRLPATGAYILDGIAAHVDEPGQSGPEEFLLSTAAVKATLAISGGSEVRFALHPHPDSAIERAGLSLFLPLDVAFHVPEFRNVGRLIDAEMPVGEKFSCRPDFNFILIDLDGLWLRLNTADHRFNRAGIEIHRHDLAFQLSFEWDAAADATLAVFDSMEAAVADWRSWMERTYSVTRLVDRPNAPDWIHNTRLVITCDMLRSTWEVTHSYADVARLATELNVQGCPPDTVFYLPGWHGAYDSTNPTYWPREELGGEHGFRTMIETLHGFGYRAMVHATGFGIDPFHPQIDALEPMVLRYDDGVHRGWQTNERWLPPRDSLRFLSGRVPIAGPGAGGSFDFDTVPIPGKCEALLTVGGVRGSGRVRLTLGHRSIVSPPAWFDDHESYEFPFPLLLEAGENRIAVAVDDGAELDWSQAWYEVRYTFVPADPYTSWTWPILVADVENQDYIHLFASNLKSVVEEFGIDAVHVDATFHDNTEGTVRHPGALMRALREALGGVPVCGESITGFEDLGFWIFTQAATQSLVRSGQHRTPADQASLPMTEGLSELYGWLDRTSPVCEFAKEYTLSYPHLCAANAFVPVGKVCNTFPPRRTPATDAEQWAVLREARRLDHLPGLRFNYRDYGLDEQGRLAVAELTQM